MCRAKQLRAGWFARLTVHMPRLGLLILIGPSSRILGPIRSERLSEFRALAQDGAVEVEQVDWDRDEDGEEGEERRGPF